MTSARLGEAKKPCAPLTPGDYYATRYVVSIGREGSARAKQPGSLLEKPGPRPLLPDQSC
jgi:hypothetical protein